jgi:hypothetical protein
VCLRESFLVCLCVGVAVFGEVSSAHKPRDKGQDKVSESGVSAGSREWSKSLEVLCVFTMPWIVRMCVFVCCCNAPMHSMPGAFHGKAPRN